MISRYGGCISVPWLTIAVFAVTGLVTASQFAWAPVLPALERTPAMVHGEYWRFVTTWLVHDEGLKQVAFNFPVLAVLGSLVEWRLGRGWWILAYLVGGTVGEISGIFWQPVGGGNSVALCGLAGLVAVYLAVRRDWPPQARFGFPAIVVAGGVVLVASHNLHGPPLFAGLLVGVFACWRDPGLFHLRAGGNAKAA